MSTFAIIEAALLAADLYMKVANRIAASKELTKEEVDAITERLKAHREWATNLDLSV